MTEYLVCKNKDDGKLFIVTREQRETLLDKLDEIHEIVGSRVERTFETFDDAIAYMQTISDIDNIINKL